MKRFHVHIAVANLASSIDFYSKLFGQAPSKQKPDYAKWMLDDPRVNFAISARGHAIGVNHFGFQVDSAEELHALKLRAETATGEQVITQADAACCYANSDKHWTMDPQGLAWEHFHTMSDAQQFGADTINVTGACCVPVKSSAQDDVTAKSACCIPNNKSTGSCCS